MSPVSSINSAAVLILQQVTRSASSDDSRTLFFGAGLVAAANGAQDPDATYGVARQAKAKIAESYFKPNAPSVTEMKLHLMKRVGEEFGIELSEYADHASFGRAIRDAIDDLRWNAEGILKLAAIEKELGLDALGFSLDTFVDAIVDPEGSAGKRVDAALKEHLGKLDESGDKGESALAALKALRFDETGLYGLVQN